jgi:hypothetical protein
MNIDTNFTITQISFDAGEKWECVGEEIKDVVKLYPTENIPQFMQDDYGVYIEVIDSNEKSLKRSFKIESRSADVIVLRDEFYYKNKKENS